LPSILVWNLVFYGSWRFHEVVKWGILLKFPASTKRIFDGQPTSKIGPNSQHTAETAFDVRTTSFKRPKFDGPGWGQIWTLNEHRNIARMLLGLFWSDLDVEWTSKWSRNVCRPNYYVGIPTWLVGDLKHPNLDVYSTSNFDQISTIGSIWSFSTSKELKGLRRAFKPALFDNLPHLNWNSKFLVSLTQKFTIELCSFSTR